MKLIEREQAIQESQETLTERELALDRIADRESALEELQKAQEALRHSERRLNAIIQSAMDAIITVDEQGRVLIFNAAAERMFGYTACEVTGGPMERFIPQRFRASHGAHVHRFIKTGASSQTLGTQGGIWGLRANGDEFPLETSISQVEADGKKFLTVILRDISERKRAEELRERLAAVVESSDDAIIGKTLDGVITSWNRGAENLFGYASSEAVGKRMQMFIPPERGNEEADILARIGRGESVEHFETVRVRKDGKTIDVSVTISPIRDSSGAVVGASKIARDITDRKRAEQRLADKVKELARSNRELEQFAYVASHDLQEPLRMVASYTQLLSERYCGKLDENADKFLGYAREGALRMQVLIQDLLAFSRVVRPDVTRKEVDCTVALQEAVQSLTAAIEESGAVVTHYQLPNVWADQTQIAQVFQNLIGNAIKFRNGEPPECAVSAEKSGRNWLFSVRDKGIGIAPEHAENIFVVFQRLHARSEYPGNGIGLAICKKIIEHYGGTIWVESQVGQGSTFKFTLPVAAPEEEGRAQS